MSAGVVAGTMRVPYVDLAAQYGEEREELLREIDRTLSTGQWVGGETVRAFEQALARANDIPHVVGVGSGTDALILGLRALDIGPGDEVITAPNSFVSSAAAIVAVGAVPVFADVLADQTIDPAAVEAKIGPVTKALMPVHLTGRCAAMEALLDLAARHGLRVIEDAAQAYGSRLGAQRAGCMGDVGCFSGHPLKNLNAVGDAGFVFCRSATVAARIRRLSNNGMSDRDTVEEWGTVSRLDPVQAVALGFRLGRVDRVIAARRAHATRYGEKLDARHVFSPRSTPGQFHTFHTFVVQVERRDELRSHLQRKGIGTGVHYPRPIHLQPAAASLGYRVGDFPVVERQAQRILSLPIHPSLCPDDIDLVCDEINGFYR
ncbi:MAG: DegT/DnrJ/EryC1/StrS family aminotransferase [Nannocystaceae bacterium]